MQETSDPNGRPFGMAQGPLIRGSSIVALIAAVVIPLVGCDSGADSFFSKPGATACPRPQIPTGLSPQFQPPPPQNPPPPPRRFHRRLLPPP